MGSRHQFSVDYTCVKSVTSLRVFIFANLKFIKIDAFVLTERLRRKSSITVTKQNSPYLLVRFNNNYKTVCKQQLKLVFNVFCCMRAHVALSQNENSLQIENRCFIFLLPIVGSEIKVQYFLSLLQQLDRSVFIYV